MKIQFMIAAALSFSLIAISNQARAESAQCQNISAALSQVSQNAFIPADLELRRLASTGLNPADLPEFVRVAEIYVEAFHILDNLSSLSGQNSCQASPASTSQCEVAMAPATLANSTFQQLHMAFSAAIQSGNIPLAGNLLPELFTSENFLDQVNSNIQKACFTK